MTATTTATTTTKSSNLTTTTSTTTSTLTTTSFKKQTISSSVKNFTTQNENPNLNLTGQKKSGETQDIAVKDEPTKGIFNTVII